MKVFSLPEGVNPPSFADSMVDGRYSREKDDQITEAFYADLEATLRALGYNGKRTGKLVRFPIADGYAVYMVCEGKTSSLIHIPIHDAWSLPEWQLRGLTKTEINRMVDAPRLFGEKR